MTTTEQPAEEASFAPLDWGLLIVPAVIWGGSFLFMAIGLDAFEPGVVTLLRVLFGLVALVFLPAAKATVDPADRPKIILLGFTWMAFPLTLFPIAQQWIDSSLAGMLNAAMPLMTALISWLVFSVPTGPRRLIGVSIGMAGILLIGIPEASTDGTNALGVLLVVIAVTSYGVAVNLTGPLQQKYGSVPVIARALTAALVFTLPYGLWGLQDSTFAWDSLIACAVVGAGGTGLAFVMAATLTGRVGPVRTSLITYVVPIISIVLGVIFRDETVTVLAVIGTAVVLFGAWWSSRAEPVAR
ncbi:MAG: DMT family transporter [Actinomycetota bacterium]